jgi:hypothetical protein
LIKSYKKNGDVFHLRFKTIDKIFEFI